MCFTFRDFLLKYFKVNKNYPAFEFSLDALTFEATCCTIFSFFYFVILGNEFDWESFNIGCMCAILNTSGFMMLSIAIVTGYAGPANALNSI